MRAIATLTSCPPDNLLTMAKRRRPGNEPPAVRPFDVDGVRTVAVGTVLWAIAFIVLAIFRDDLDEQGLGWWLWTCLAGVGLGLLGLEYTRKRRDAIARARLQEEADRLDDVDRVPGDTDLIPTDDAEPPNGSHPEPAPARTEAMPALIEPTPVHTEPMPAPIELKPALIEPNPAPIEPMPVRGEPTPARTQPKPARTQPMPARGEPPPANATPEPAQAGAHSQPAEPAQAGLLDVEPLIPPRTPESRRARRAARNVDQVEPDDDEPLLPTATDRRRSLDDGRPSEGRRARRSDAQDDDDEVSDGESLYRGRRARRP